MQFEIYCLKEVISYSTISTMNNQYCALYYPTIEFQNYAWLCSAALLWDRIYRIVPSSYIPADSGNVRTLLETGEIGIPINPDRYVRKVADEFISRLESGYWDAAALTYDIQEQYIRLHRDKVDVKLRELIIAQGKAKKKGEWLHVPVEFEAHYMTYLANAIARRNNLSILTDSIPAWTGATYFNYDGEVEDFPREDLTHLLATVVIRDFIPQNIIAIKPKDIIKFREKYRDERRRFMLAMQSAAGRISSCEEPSIVQDIIEDIKRDVESALKDYRQSLQVLNVTGLTGLTSFTFPALTKVASMITGQDLSAQTLVVLSVLGFGVGLVSGLSELGHKRRKLSKESDYSYLMHLGRKWKNCAMYNNDYNYYLCRTMEEFIND